MSDEYPDDANVRDMREEHEREHFGSVIRDDAAPLGVAGDELIGPMQFVVGNADDMAKVAARLNALRTAVEELSAANNIAIGRLQAQGIGAQLPPVNLLMLSTLLDMIVGDVSSPARWQYELRYQQNLANELDKAAGQVSRAKLTAPGVVPPRGSGGLIIPGR